MSKIDNPKEVPELKAKIWNAKYKSVKIKAGEKIDVAENKVLILVREGNFYKQLKSLTETDGTSRPLGIIVESADATIGPVDAQMYIKGDVLDTAFVDAVDNILTGEPKQISIRDALRQLGINVTKEAK